MAEELGGYSQSTANKLICLFAEYGAKLTADPEDSPNSESIPNLNYTQAIILLGIPEEERESQTSSFLHFLIRLLVHHQQKWLVECRYRQPYAPFPWIL